MVSHEESFFQNIRTRFIEPHASPTETTAAASTFSNAQVRGLSINWARASTRKHNEVMTEAVPRPELDAKLDALRQEMRADFSSLRADIASMSGDTRGAIGEMRGSLDGMKSAISMFQWVIGTIFAALALWVAYAQLSSPEKSQPAPQPTVIVVPGNAIATTPTPTQPVSPAPSPR